MFKTVNLSRSVPTIFTFLLILSLVAYLRYTCNTRHYRYELLPNQADIALQCFCSYSNSISEDGIEIKLVFDSGGCIRSFRCLIVLISGAGSLVGALIAL
jgi:hypothetical protein